MALTWRPCLLSARPAGGAAAPAALRPTAALFSQLSTVNFVSPPPPSGGVLPYLIMLHRPSKSVVLSVRGTGAGRPKACRGAPPPHALPVPLPPLAHGAPPRRLPPPAAFHPPPLPLLPPTFSNRPCFLFLLLLPAVSMEDLITDLLSNPVDVGDWVPAWVAQEAAARAAAGIAGDASGADLKV